MALTSNDFHRIQAAREPQISPWGPNFKDHDVWECLECGALVTLKDTHIDWHTGLESDLQEVYAVLNSMNKPPQ